MRRCIGTIINSKNILCSVGVVVEQMYMQMVTSWRAIYMVMVEIGMYMLNSFGGTLSQNIVMAFPTDQFYSLVCACKDVYASAVGVAIAVIESMADLITTGRIDLTIHRALSPQESVLSTQIRSLGTLAFNIVADSTLYPLLALHRWIMCLVNAGLSVQHPVQQLPSRNIFQLPHADLLPLQARHVSRSARLLDVQHLPLGNVHVHHRQQQQRLFAHMGGVLLGAVP